MLPLPHELRLPPFSDNMRWISMWWWSMYVRRACMSWGDAFSMADGKVMPGERPEAVLREQGCTLLKFALLKT